MSAATHFVEVCSLADIPEDEGLKVEAPTPIALFRIGEEVFATQDGCTHDVASLSEGWFEDGVVECPFHNAKFCVRTGKVLCAPASIDLATYPVRVEGGQVFVNYSSQEPTK